MKVFRSRTGSSADKAAVADEDDDGQWRMTMAAVSVLLMLILCLLVLETALGTALILTSHHFLAPPNYKPTD